MNTRSINALTEVPFFPTTIGPTTVRDVLVQSHDPAIAIRKDMPAYEFTSLTRFLASIVAVVIQNLGISGKQRKLAKLAHNGLGEEEVDRVIDQLAFATDIYDAEIPFMQQPALNLTNPKDKATFVGKGVQPVKKLLPSMPPDEAEDFWHLLTADDEVLPLDAALPRLITFHYFSMAGNNAYAGQKCQYGAPSARFVGKDKTATEILWEGESLLKSLLYMIPENWAEGHGLPAWADRRCEQSRQGAEIHPLWAATWSSNAATVAWENDIMIGVRTGGIPERWYLPEMGTSKEERKRWWDTRNVADSFYFYMDNPDKGDAEPKLQRVDLGRDTTALAVDWAANKKTQHLRNPHIPRLIKPDQSATIIFAQHRVEGTSTSANIRSSQISTPSRDLWSFDADPKILDSIALRADLVQRIHSIVCGPFRRVNKNDPPQIKREVLDFLRDARPDASAAFWRHADSVFAQMLKEVRMKTAANEPTDFISAALRKSLIEAADQAFDEVVSPYYSRKPAQISYTRSRVHAHVVRAINNEVPVPVSIEDKDK